MLSHIQHGLYLSFIQAFRPHRSLRRFFHEAFTGSHQRHLELTSYFLEMRPGQAMLFHCQSHAPDACAQTFNVPLAQVQ
jgi:hypothetical protein